MTRKLALLAALSAAFALPAADAGAARAPASFVSIAPQGETTASDYALMKTSEVSSVRLAMYWSVIQPKSPFVRPDFSDFDREVRVAAEHGIRVFPFVWGSPGWISSQMVDMPAGPWQRRQFTGFLRLAVHRYGPDGSFWNEHPAVDYLPIRTWEIWNEENIVTFSSTTDPGRYAKLLRDSGRVLHQADPGSKVIVGGLFGRPLQIPPNTDSDDYLSRLYSTPGLKRYFDGVALHPYVADAGAMRAQIVDLRRVMALHQDAGTPLYMTEVGWGSDSFESRWERGPRGQARELNQAMSMLVRHRASWQIGGIWWFSWVDLNGSCQFCDSAGLLTAQREAKPAWYLFNRWTGGDPDTVSRASFGD
jgi:polysaccharide biosynthesis protein PslG